jgi:hypothetical protein
MSAWLQSSPWPTAELRTGRRFAALALAAFAIVLWFGVPHGIGSSWRECDTQTIARNFLLDGFDPLRPRIDWRGETDGAVECEFPLYQLLIAAVMSVFGIVEWPGRLLALLSTLTAAFAVHRLLERRSGPSAACAGLVAFLATGSVAMLAVRVVPDGLSLAATNLGLLAFVRYLGSGSRATLAVAVVATMIGGLQKPLALQVGLVMFGWALLLAPRRLRDPWLWLGFVVIPAAVAMWLVHGAYLHAETGLTFGVVSGGDTKFPDLAHALDPATWAGLWWTTTQFGFSVFATLGFLVLLVRRQLDRADFALLFATGAGLFVSLRYSCTQSLGPQYHAFAAVAGAWIVARAWPQRAPRWLWLVFLSAAAAHAGWRARDERGVRIVVNSLPIVEVAAATRPLVQAGDRLIVRADKPRRDAEWGRVNNCEDPRFFYLTGLRGWVVAADEWDLATLQGLHQRGARWVYDSHPETTGAEVAAWLAAAGECRIDLAGGRVWQLRDGAARR